MKNPTPLATESHASQQLAAALDRECPEGRLAAVIGECLSATVMTKNGSVIPDSRTRLAAASLALSYRIGLPLARSAVAVSNVAANEDADFAERLKRSPALRRCLQKIIFDADNP